MTTLNTNQVVTPDEIKVSFMQNLLKRIYEQGLSFMLLAVYIIYSHIQRQYDRTEWRDELKEIKKERDDCTDETKNLLFKIVQANTIAIERSNQDHEKIINIIDRYEKD